MMRKRHVLAPLALATLVGLVSGVPVPEGEMLLKDRDQQALGKSIAAYFQAKRNEKGINVAFEDLQKSVAKVEKRFAKQLGGDTILKSVADWEKAVYHAGRYRDSGVRKGRLVTVEFEDEAFRNTHSYAIRVPKAYSAKKGPFPLLLCIPPKGEDGETHLRSQWVDPGGRDTAVIVACTMPSNVRMWGEIGGPDNPGGIDTILFTLRRIKEQIAVDPDRIFLTGFGEGVATAVRIAAIFPHVFAGVIGRAGDLDDTGATNFRNVPTLFAGGGEKCASFQGKAKAEGFENVTLDPTATEADVWAWLGERVRDANPTEVLLAPLHEKGNSAYWIRVDRFDVETGPRVRATADRATNTIQVEGEGVAMVTIFFNDRLVDMGKPVKVVCNGEVHEELVPRNLKQLLDLAYMTGDPGRVFTNAKTYELPAPVKGEGQ